MPTLPSPTSTRWFKRPAGIASSALLAAGLVGGALALAVPASADTTAQAACTDAGGHAWKVTTVWSPKTYKEEDGTTRIINNNLAFTTSAPDTDTVDYTLTTYDGAGKAVSTKKVDDAAFNFKSGTRSLTLDPRNPPTAPGKSKIVLSVGDGNDHRANCSVTFVQPGGVVTPPTTTPKPTATPTLTPTPTPTTPPPVSTGEFPSASNTGVPAGTQLSAYTGPMTITTAGTVIDAKKINGCLTIKADNVTIKRSLLTGNCFFNVLNDDGNTNFVMSDIEIDGQSFRADGAAIGGRSYTLLRANIHGTGDGLKLGDNVTVQDSYIHDLYGANDSHNDGMQASDGAHIRIVHNTILPVYSGATSSIIIKADFGPISDLVFDNNFVGGGAYTVYGGDGYGNDIPDATGVKITNNQFTTRYFAKGGAFGPITSTGSGTLVTGNVWADGPEKGQTVS